MSTRQFKSYRHLEVWRKAVDLVVECYQITRKFSKNEIFGLTSQLQRAADKRQLTTDKADPCELL